MDERRNDLPHEIAGSISTELASQGREALEHVVDLDSRLTKTNFLTNAGGAIAVLAFLGTPGAVPALKFSLVFFTFGVIATGIELRALMLFFGDLEHDATRRRRGFAENTLTVKEASDVQVRSWPRRINHIAGWVSQLCFALGVVVGAIGVMRGGT